MKDTEVLCEACHTHEGHRGLREGGDPCMPYKIPASAKLVKLMKGTEVSAKLVKLMKGTEVLREACHLREGGDPCMPYKIPASGQ